MERMEYFHPEYRTEVYTYDQKGNVLTEEYWNGSFLRGYSYTYDENQNLINEVLYVDNDKDNKKEIVSEDVYIYDENQHQISQKIYKYSLGVREVYCEVYFDYDEEGREVASYWCYFPYNLWNCFWTEYDEKGRVHKRERDMNAKGVLEEVKLMPRILLEHYMYQDYEDGSYIELVQSYGGNILSDLEVNHYDAKGHCVETMYYCCPDPDIEKYLEWMTPQEEAVWNSAIEDVDERTIADWLELTEALCVGERAVTTVTRESWEYDENENIIYYEQNDFWETNDRLQEMVSREITVYDDLQRKVSQTYQYTSGLTVTHTYEYNAMNHMVLDKIESVKEEGEEATYKEAIYHYTYAYSGEDIWQ